MRTKVREPEPLLGRTLRLYDNLRVAEATQPIRP